MTLGEVSTFICKMGIAVPTIQKYEAYITCPEHSEGLYVHLAIVTIILPPSGHLGPGRGPRLFWGPKRFGALLRLLTSGQPPLDSLDLGSGALCSSPGFVTS